MSNVKNLKGRLINTYEPCNDFLNKILKNPENVKIAYSKPSYGLCEHCKNLKSIGVSGRMGG